MSFPVQSNPFNPSGYQYQDQSIDKKAETEDAEVLNEASSQEKESELESEFNTLINRYYRTIQITAGCGDRAQGYIDSEWKNLAKFADEHPEFKSRLPKSKQRSYDDGTGGMATGMATFAANARRNDDDCTIS